MFRKIMLATDGSEHSQHAADKAILLAGYEQQASIEIVYVVDDDQVKSEVIANWKNNGSKDLRSERLRELERRAKAAGVAYTITFLQGNPGKTLVDYANKQSFDIVIIGSRGLNTLQEFVLGSVSHKVAKRVNCPVLIVKPPADE